MANRPNPGTVSVTAYWAGTSYDIAPVVISNTSVLFQFISTNATFYMYSYYGSISYVLLVGYLVTDPSTAWDLWPLYNNNYSIAMDYPYFTLQKLDQTHVRSIRNTYDPTDKITLSLPICESTTLTTSVYVIVNLIPQYDYDLDIGNPTGIAITANVNSLYIKLSTPSLTQGFIITIALDWPVTACSTHSVLSSTSTCTINDPVGYVTFVILFNSALFPTYTTPLQEIGTISSDNVWGGVQANITHINGSGISINTTMVAGVWKTLLQPMWQLDKQGSVNITYAFNLLNTQNNAQDALDIVYIIANKHRAMRDVILFGTDFELSMTIQLLDMYGVYALQ
jgi:hypothetical protein